MGFRVSYVIFVLLLWQPLYAFGGPNICPPRSLAHSLSPFPDLNCPLHADPRSLAFNGVTEGDEGSLQRALNMVHKNRYDYVAVLFYASWCPFSRMFRPTFSTLASLYPSIPHFAIEESAIRPSILSKYGVHGFPTLFILNSTTRARYRPPRTPQSLVAFYGDVTGIRTASPDELSADRIMRQSTTQEKHGGIEQESCPFWWARSPENLLRHETYLALATAFVVTRLLYLIFPTMLGFVRCAWRRYVRNVRFSSLLEKPMAYLKRAVQLSKSLREPCKRSNLQEGAMNAKAWASKSLATVSIGDASTSRCGPLNDCH